MSTGPHIQPSPQEPPEVIRKRIDSTENRITGLLSSPDVTDDAARKHLLEIIFSQASVTAVTSAQLMGRPTEARPQRGQEQELEGLRGQVERLALHILEMRKEIDKLRASSDQMKQYEAARKTSLLEATSESPPGGLPMHNPWHQWIANNRLKLKEYQGRDIVIDYEKGIVVDAQDGVDFARKLQAYIQEQPDPEKSRKRLLVTQASLYLDEP